MHADPVAARDPIDKYRTMIIENAIASVSAQRLAILEEPLTHNKKKLCFYSSKF
jgi:hypothetical protein